MMEETKVIYHIDDQETPYLIKIPKVADQITLQDLKIALNRFHYKYFFKSMDDDFGVVKEEIVDEKSKLPSFNGRIITWLVTSESSVSDSQSLCADVTADLTLEKNKKSSRDNVNEAKNLETKRPVQQPNPQGPPTSAGTQRKFQSQVERSHLPQPRSGFDATSSVVSSDIDTTSFVDSDEETHTRYSTSTHASHSTRHHGQKKKKRRHKLPVLSQASSFSSITDSTMSLNIVTITLNMETASFLGISIVGQSTRGSDGGIYVGSIMKGGAVAQDGRIEPGDMILEVNGVSFENMSNDDAVRTLREAVQRPGPITLVVAKCWDSAPKGYFTIPRQEPVRPIDPSAWVMHSEAMRGMWAPRAAGPPSVSSLTSATSSLISSVPPNDFIIRAAHSSATSSSSHSSKGYADLNLTKNADMAVVVRAMAQQDSGLDIRDRMWLKIPIPQSFIGSELVDWLYTHVEGFADRRDARRYACNLLKYGFIQHTVNKISFSEQCYYIFGSNVTHEMSSLSLADDIDSVSSVGTQQRDGIGPLPPPPSWNLPTYPIRPTYPLSPNAYNPTPGGMMLGPPSTPYNYVNDGASYISMPGYNGAESVISSVKRDNTCACIVTHTYKQIRKLWDNPDKPQHHPTSRAHQIQANTNSPLLGKMAVNKFAADIDQSTSSDTDSEDSASSQSKNSKDMSKQTVSSSTTKTGGCDSGVGSVGACGDRSLPPLPGATRDGCINSGDSGRQQQPFRNTYLDDTLKVMADL